MPDTLRIALPNKGRLEQPAADLLKQAGFYFERTPRSLAVPIRDAPIELLFIRAKDVVELVADGVADLGVTGIDLTREADSPVNTISELGFGRCRLVAAVPDSSPISDIEGFQGLRIATSHPRTVERFFDDKAIAVTTVPLNGSVEVAPKLGIADAVADLVSSGSTMLINGLRPVATLLESQAILIERIGASRTDTATRVIAMLDAAMAAKNRRYVVMNAPRSAVAEIEEIIPGIEAPTIVPLTHDGMVAIHSVVESSDVWHVLPRLKEAGASGILVLPVQQVIA
ncbi:MAG: ATP phosphoribosyltransferase [Actinomycetota bacterium]|nr:ATP phosphoribosyltransferase [Actinomycetota bacterium]MDK1039206.1 ATP phosphoribosyltransferase [Actinomycetota bacterium]MDK1097266.1 ATP phosphoribosyltransferase [Actinomycetota bacterium]MDK1103704.1 ATP phosphoribosyltransferase [Actinomycetota bacterium]MDK1292429.1 ATP phosphoribosyltransferase [Actinomycetota bacterium]